MVSFKLKENQTGYEVIEDYFVKRFNFHLGTYEQYLVALELSYDNVYWRSVTDILQTDSMCFDWGIDWYEGEKYIRLLGVKNIEDIDIIGEGV